MRQSSRKLERLDVVFDDRNAVANAGLVPPMTLAGRLGLRELVEANVHLGDAPGRANPGHKTMALVASALVGGDSIDDADVLRSGRAAEGRLARGCRPHRRSAHFCAASVGPTPAAWTKWQVSC